MAEKTIEELRTEYKEAKKRYCNALAEQIDNDIKNADQRVTKSVLTYDEAKEEHSKQAV